MRVTQQIEAFWHEFLTTRPDLPAGTRYYEAFMFGNGGELAAECAAAVLAGEKTATSGLLWALDAAEERPPRPGDFSIVLDEHGKPVCVIETIEASVRRFDEVDEQFAWEYGEGERTLSWWRSALWSYYARECAQHGWKPSERMPLVCERFRVVYQP